MANRFFTFVTNLLAGATARVEHVNTQFQAVDAGFLGVANELNRSIRFTAGSVPAESKFQIGQTDAQRANLALGFDSAGNLSLRSFSFTWRGDWDDVTFYAAGDVIRAPESVGSSLYIAVSSHTSAASFGTDLSAGKWNLMIDLSQVSKAARKFKVITSADSPYAAAAGDDLFVDTTAAAVTVNLPADPDIEDQPITIAHFAGNASSNPVTIGRNGKLIMAAAANISISVNDTVLQLAFSNDTRGWRLL